MHTEHNKIGFAILGFSYDFQSILQVSAKAQQGEESFYWKPPGSF
jgi:hypothetical protein